MGWELIFDAKKKGSNRVDHSNVIWTVDNVLLWYTLFVGSVGGEYFQHDYMSHAAE